MSNYKCACNKWKDNKSHQRSREYQQRKKYVKRKQTEILEVKNIITERRKRRKSSLCGLNTNVKNKGKN